MNKIDIIIPTVIFIFIVGAGIFFISEWLEEKTMTLSERMVNNINSMTPAQTSCKELTQGIRELPETLEDYELVKKALTLKSIEMECKKYSSSIGEIKLVMEKYESSLSNKAWELEQEKIKQYDSITNPEDIQEGISP